MCVFVDINVKSITEHVFESDNQCGKNDILISITRIKHNNGLCVLFFTIANTVSRGNEHMNTNKQNF